MKLYGLLKSKAKMGCLAIVVLLAPILLYGQEWRLGPNVAPSLHNAHRWNETILPPEFFQYVYTQVYRLLHLWTWVSMHGTVLRGIGKWAWA